MFIYVRYRALRGHFSALRIDRRRDSHFGREETVNPYEVYFTKELLSDMEKLEDYLDYLHIQKVKKQTQKTLSLEEVRRELSAD